MCYINLKNYIHYAAPCGPLGQPVLLNATETGTVASPNYGNGVYPAQTSCSWLIEAPAGPNSQSKIQSLETVAYAFRV